MSPTGAWPTAFQRAWRIERGTCRIRVGDGSWMRISAGEWTFTPTGLVEHEFSGDAVITSIAYEMRWVTGVQLFELAGLPRLVARRERELNAASAALLRFVTSRFTGSDTLLRQRRADFASFVELQSLMLRWGVAAYRSLLAAGEAPTPFRVEDDRLTHALTVLEAWPLDQPLDRHELAQQCGLTYTHLARLMVESLGLTPYALYTRRRLRLARQMLRAGDVAIKEIAFAVGFRQPPYFTRWFRQQTGHAPSQHVASQQRRDPAPQ